METIVDRELPKFEKRGRMMRVNFDEESFTQESEGQDDKPMWRYTTAEFFCTASRRERVSAILAACGHDDEAHRDKADMLARESLGQELSDAYVIEMQRRKYQRERDAALQAMTHTFDDGAVVQVRPQDMGNFQTAIANGADQDWIMEDNTVRLTTVEELQAAMASGVAQGKAIWDDYAEKIKAL